MKTKLFSCLCSLLIFSSVLLNAQTTDKNTKKRKLEELKTAWEKKYAGLDSLNLPDSLKAVYLEDSVTFQRYNDHLTAYFDYKISGYKHRQKVFSWQLFSSKVIFFCVVFLVLTGLYFSYLQFQKAMTANKTAPSEKINLASELEASPTGIKISSPVLGVIILIISLLFFYLYLIHIYPIKEIF